MEQNGLKEDLWRCKACRRGTWIKADSKGGPKCMWCGARYMEPSFPAKNEVCGTEGERAGAGMAGVAIALVGFCIGIIFLRLSCYG